MITMTHYDALLNAMRDGWPETHCTIAEAFLAIWQERLKTTARALSRQFDAMSFESQLPLRLRDMDFLPVLLVAGPGDGAKKAIATFKYSVWGGCRLPIVLCMTDEAHVIATGCLPPAGGLILSRAEVAHIIQASQPLESFRMRLLNQIPFRRLIPYSTTHPAVGPMFVGRTESLEMLIHEDNSDYCIFGPGMIGKSSLLAQLQWVLRRQRSLRHDRIVAVDLYACPRSLQAAAQLIAREISATRFSFHLGVNDLEAFLRRIHAQDPRFASGPIELIIDEADAILACDSREGYPLLRVLRQAKWHKLIRLTICGRGLVAEVLGDPNCPFHKRMHLVSLAPLAESEARALFFEPLGDLGIRFADEEVAWARVARRTKGEPRLLQAWGWEVSNLVASHSNRTVTDAMLDGIERAGVGVA